LTSAGIEQRSLFPVLFEFGVAVDKRPLVFPPTDFHCSVVQMNNREDNFNSQFKTLYIFSIPQTSTVQSFRWITEEVISIPG
jgi:hypothetical protein